MAFNHPLSGPHAMTDSEKTFLASLPRTTTELIDYNGQAFYNYASERVNAIDDPERFARCYDAAAEGADGSLHCEAIDDMRDYADTIYRDFERNAESMGEDEAESWKISGEVEKARAALDADLDRLEQWHIDNGTYEQQVG
jgi:hypothetical protein